jgi:hypothetical protein
MECLTSQDRHGLEDTLIYRSHFLLQLEAIDDFQIALIVMAKHNLDPIQVLMTKMT